MTNINKAEIIDSIRFFGSVASTNGIAENIKKEANRQIARMVDALGPEVDRILAEANGIITNSDED